MHFSRPFVTMALLASSALPVLGALSPAQIVSNIQMLTTKSQALQSPAQSITILNGPLIIIGQGPFPVIITGFTDIVSTATTAIAQMQGTTDIASGPDADSVFDAFREFVRVHQVLLNILIGKAGLFNTVPIIGQPVAAVLRQVESVVDTIALGLIDIVDSRASDLQRQTSALDDTLAIAIRSYEGIQTTKRSNSSPISRIKRHLLPEAVAAN